MIIIPKFEDYGICLGLTNKEYACRCEFDACIATIVSPKLITAYEKFRRMVGMPVFPTSGYRCQRHHFENVYDSDMDKVTLSRHLTGEAIDFYVNNLLEKYDVPLLFELLENAGFTFTKYYDDMKVMHADVR